MRCLSRGLCRFTSFKKSMGGIIPDETESVTSPARSVNRVNTYGQGGDGASDWSMVSVTSALRFMVVDPPVNRVANGMNI